MLNRLQSSSSSEESEVVHSIGSMSTEDRAELKGGSCVPAI